MQAATGTFDLSHLTQGAPPPPTEEEQREYEALLSKQREATKHLPLNLSNNLEEVLKTAAKEGVLTRVQESESGVQDAGTQRAESPQPSTATGEIQSPSDSTSSDELDFGKILASADSPAVETPAEVPYAKLLAEKLGLQVESEEELVSQYQQALALKQRTEELEAQLKAAKENVVEDETVLLFTQLVKEGMSPAELGNYVTFLNMDWNARDQSTGAYAIADDDVLVTGILTDYPNIPEAQVREEVSKMSLLQKATTAKSYRDSLSKMSQGSKAALLQRAKESHISIAKQTKEAKAQWDSLHQTLDAFEKQKNTSIAGVPLKGAEHIVKYAKSILQNDNVLMHLFGDGKGGWDADKLLSAFVMFDPKLSPGKQSYLDNYMKLMYGKETAQVKKAVILDTLNVKDVQKTSRDNEDGHGYLDEQSAQKAIQEFNKQMPWARV